MTTKQTLETRLGLLRAKLFGQDRREEADLVNEAMQALTAARAAGDEA